MPSRFRVPRSGQEIRLPQVYQWRGQAGTWFISFFRRAVPNKYGGVFDCGIDKDRCEWGRGR